jgi:hypothetical protein
MYLLDTNVISELRRSRPHGAVLAWLRPLPESQLSISAITIFELQVGVERTRHSDPDKAREISAWITRVVETFRVIDIDQRVARAAATLLHGQSPDLQEDGMIAATALVHNLAVVTRDISDFAHFDVPTFDPFIIQG